MQYDATERRFLELEQLSEEFAEAQAQADYLDDFSKSLLAKLMKEAEAAGFSSAVLQEREARRHESYLAHLEGKKAATQDALSKKWRLTIAQMRFEWARSKEATRRAEMNLR